jgi:hypothetical protein
MSQAGSLLIRSATPSWRRRNAICFAISATAKTRAAGARVAAWCRSLAIGIASSRCRPSNGRNLKSCASPFARCFRSARANARKACGCFDDSLLPREAGKGDHPKFASASEGWWKGRQTMRTAFTSTPPPPHFVWSPSPTSWGRREKQTSPLNSPAISRRGRARRRFRRPAPAGRTNSLAFRRSRQAATARAALRSRCLRPKLSCRARGRA